MGASTPVDSIHHCGRPVMKVRMADTRGCKVHGTTDIYVAYCTCRPVTIACCQVCNWSRRS